ncbi:MAG: hypothetical protein Q8N55_00410 [bacterium]|nr:hypothetical protein [bacterium]
MLNNDQQLDFDKVSNPLLFPLLMFSLFFLIVKYFRDDKKFVFLWVITILMFLESIFSISVLRFQHLILLVPFCVILIVRFLYNLFYVQNFKKTFYVVIILILILNVVSLYSTYSFLKQNGSLPYHFLWGHPSDVVYELADYLEENKITDPITIGPVLTTNLKVLTEYEVIPTMCFTRLDAGSYDECVKPDRYYITRVDDWNIDFFKKGEDVFQKHNKRFEVIKSFRGRNGKEEIIIGKLSDLPAPSL